MSVADCKFGGEETYKNVMKEGRLDLTSKDDQSLERQRRREMVVRYNRKVEIGFCIFGCVSPQNLSRRQGQ